MSDTTLNALLIGTLVGCVGLLVFAVVREIKHPCLRYSSTPQQCVYFTQIGDVQVPNFYDCTPCVERAP